MHEVIIGTIFTDLFGPTRGPNIALFERFQQSSATINQENFVALDDTRLADPLLQELRAEVASFLQSFLSIKTSFLLRLQGND